MSEFLQVDGIGPCAKIVYANRRGMYVQSLLVKTCPKCGRYLQTIPVPFEVVVSIGAIGKWRCLSCGYIPEDNKYDKKGAELDKEGKIL